MATSGCGNRLAGGNRFFQGPKGTGWRSEPRAPAAASGESSPWGGHRDPPPPGVTAFPAPAAAPGWAPASPPPPPNNRCANDPAGSPPAGARDAKWGTPPLRRPSLGFQGLRAPPTRPTGRGPAPLVQGSPAHAQRGHPTRARGLRKPRDGRTQPRAPEAQAHLPILTPPSSSPRGSPGQGGVPAQRPVPSGPSLGPAGARMQPDAEGPCRQGVLGAAGGGSGAQGPGAPRGRGPRSPGESCGVEGARGAGVGGPGGASRNVRGARRAVPLGPGLGGDSRCPPPSGKGTPFAPLCGRTQTGVPPHPHFSPVRGG